MGYQQFLGRNQNLIQVHGLDELLATLSPELGNSIAYSTIDKVSRKAFTEVKRAISRGYTIKQNELTLQYIKPSKYNFKAYISAKRRSRSLINFKGKQIKGKAGGVAYESRRGDKRFIKGAFIAKTRNFNYNKSGREYTNIFIRTKSTAYPIKSFYGPSEDKLIQSEWIQTVIKTTIAANIGTIFNHEVEFKLSRKFKLKMR
jgi:hypothetical protein